MGAVTAWMPPATGSSTRAATPTTGFAAPMRERPSAATAISSIDSVQVSGRESDIRPDPPLNRGQALPICAPDAHDNVPAQRCRGARRAPFAAPAATIGAPRAYVAPLDPSPGSSRRPPLRQPRLHLGEHRRLFQHVAGAAHDAGERIFGDVDREARLLREAAVEAAQQGAAAGEGD